MRPDAHVEVPPFLSRACALNPSGSLRTASQDRADGGIQKAKTHFEASKMLFWLASAIFQALCDPPSTRPRLHKSRNHRYDAEFKAQVAVDCLNIGSLHC